MMIVDKQYISDDIAEHFFVCDLHKCKGACCKEGGEIGAPLEEKELDMLENVFEQVKPYLTEEGIKTIEEQGLYVFHPEEGFSTPTVDAKECAYVLYDEKGVIKCGIEEAYNDKKIAFKKPISCHLYPIRITTYDEFEALNYSRWSICDDACTLGESLEVPLYQFLKEPLIRKYGLRWYDALVQQIEQTH